MIEVIFHVIASISTTEPPVTERRIEKQTKSEYKFAKRHFNGLKDKIMSTEDLCFLEDATEDMKLKIKKDLLKFTGLVSLSEFPIMVADNSISRKRVELGTQRGTYKTENRRWVGSVGIPTGEDF